MNIPQLSQVCSRALIQKTCVPGNVRHFSVTHTLEAKKGKFDKIPLKVRKYSNKLEAGRATLKNRTDMQRLFNRAYRLVPFDHRKPVTGKHTGPHIEGGSEEAQRKAALHLVQPTGYYNSTGKFIGVKEMKPVFVVPDLKGFKLKPYVPYAMEDIDKPQFTAKDLFEEFYTGPIKEEVDAEFAPKKKPTTDKKT
ncbi:uncharacterized protein LOC127846587 [Dreissena polymorpha]|uniref:Mitochondrial ribosomal protein L41 n=1 Tax=Dreissena polymorpha TaxID=45954 RepID=A0A9D4IBG6_DREPO|nr:uncharacterized protein LOC127846587 [Dreissena polymorpha]KAH3769116.1 hypothetical protein DPMN_170364 [Dreissena polymorpha]